MGKLYLICQYGNNGGRPAGIEWAGPSKAETAPLKCNVKESYESPYCWRAIDWRLFHLPVRPKGY